MKFGAVPLAEALGARLAHSLTAGTAPLKKGTVLAQSHLDALAASGHSVVTVAQLGPEDVPEDAAAERIGKALAPDPQARSLSRAAAFTGRLNLYAAADGVLVLDTEAVNHVNRIDDAVTLATLDQHARVSARQMVATVKIIPYAAPESAVAAAEAALRQAEAIAVRPVIRRSAGLILTRTPGMKDSLIEKGARAIGQRLSALGIATVFRETVPHETGALADALTRAEGEMVLILSGSATSDPADVGPAALVAAGGTLTRFGMPVDPGNLLFLGDLGARPVIGLPGCARSPKLNGADWVLERIACGIAVGHGDIARMGVGGLLKEIASRPAPREGGASAPRRPRIAAVLLGAGGSTRMGGRDKLLEPVGGKPLLRHVADVLAESAVDETLAVLRPDDSARREALSGAALGIVDNPRASEGMGTSLSAGIRALGADVDAALVVLADMPDLTAEAIGRMIAGFDPGEGRAIVRATAPDGTPGHPVLFGRRFFEDLSGLEGDQGARAVLRDYADFVTGVVLPGGQALTDLDTPEAWQAWRTANPDAEPAN